GNGTPVPPALVDRAEYRFSADNPEAEYVVTAERDGYETARRTLTGADPPGYYPLIMKPGGAGPGPEAGPTVAMRPVEPGAAATQPQAHAEAPRPPVATPLKRDIVVQTDPPNVGATIYLGDEEWGRNGLDLAGHEFKRDRNGKPIPVPISAKAPGYEGGSAVMRWEDQRSQYVIPLGRRKKDVRIVTDPAGAVVTLDDKPLPRDRTGAATATILFPPTEEQGDAPTVYTARVAATSDAWEPQELKIGWEGGRREYRVKLAPARSAKATRLRPVLV